MTTNKNNVIKIDDYTLTPEMVEKCQAVPAASATRRRRTGRRFVQVPWVWVVALAGAPGGTWHLALVLLYLHWRDNGHPITLANCTVKGDGIPHETKRRALQDLERRGLVKVEWRVRKSPVVWVRFDRV